MTRVTVSLPDEMDSEVEKEAKSLMVSKSTVIRWALRERYDLTEVKPEDTDQAAE